VRASAAALRTSQEGSEAALIAATTPSERNEEDSIVKAESMKTMERVLKAWTWCEVVALGGWVGEVGY